MAAMTPTLSITGQVATISAGEALYENILLYKVKDTDIWYTLGKRIGNGIIDFSSIILTSNTYESRVMSTGSPGVVSDIEEFTIVNNLTLDYPDPNWGRWIFASVCEHFNKYKQPDFFMYIEGQVRATANEQSFFELRVDGPRYSQIGKTTYRLYTEINVLVQRAMDNKNAQMLQYYTDSIVQIFTRCLPIFKYGKNPQDDQTQLGSMYRQDSKSDREYIQAHQFGQLDPKIRIEQSSIEAHYSMDIDV